MDYNPFNSKLIESSKFFLTFLNHLKRILDKIPCQLTNINFLWDILQSFMLRAKTMSFVKCYKLSCFFLILTDMHGLHK